MNNPTKQTDQADQADPADELPASAAFDSLAAEAAALEGVVPPGGPVGPQPGGTSPEEAAEVVELAAAIVLPFLPDRYARRYDQAALGRIAGALGKVADKYGWSVAGVMGSWGAEIALAAAVLGPVLPDLIEQAKASKAPPVPKPATVVAGPAPAPALEPDQADQVARDGRVL